MPTAMITGAAGGLGSAIATALAPTHTLFLAGRPSARLDEVAGQFGATTWPIDLHDVDDIEAVVEPIVELDVLIHNAGVAYPGRVAESTVDEWRATMSVNVVGAVALTLALLPALRAAGGHVVFINSGAGTTRHQDWRRIRRASSRCVGSPIRCATTSRRFGSRRCIPGRIATDMQEGLVAYEGADYDPSRYPTARDRRASCRRTP